MRRSDNPLLSPVSLGALSTELQQIVDEVCDISAWYVRYRHGEEDRAAGFKTPEEATEAACHFLDHGDDVVAIGEGALANSISREEIALIYARWVRAKYH